LRKRGKLIKSFGLSRKEEGKKKRPGLMVEPVVMRQQTCQRKTFRVDLPVRLPVQRRGD
jgi:hypothetical protein